MTSSDGEAAKCVNDKYSKMAAPTDRMDVGQFVCIKPNKSRSDSNGKEIYLIYKLNGIEQRKCESVSSICSLVWPFCFSLLTIR